MVKVFIQGVIPEIRGEGGLQQPLSRRGGVAEKIIFSLGLGQTNLTSGSTDYFQNLKGRLVGKKKENKKKSPIFCADFDYQ